MARKQSQYNDVIRLDSTPKRDFTIADREDNEDEISLEIDDNVGAEEEEYDNEFGYWIVKMLRGGQSHHFTSLLRVSSTYLPNIHPSLIHFALIMLPLFLVPCLHSHLTIHASSVSVINTTLQAQR